MESEKTYEGLQFPSEDPYSTLGQVQTEKVTLEMASGPEKDPEKKETKDAKSRAGMKILVINFFLLLVVSVIAVIALCLQFSKHSSKGDGELKLNQSEILLAMVNKRIFDLQLQLQQSKDLFSKNVSSLQSQVSSSNREIALLGYNKTNMQSKLQEALGKITALSKNLTVVQTELKKSKRIITALTAKKFDCCHDPWLIFNSHCYYFSDTLVTWDQSKVKCAENSSQLVVIKTDEIQDFIQRQINPSNSQRNAHPIYWIGLTDNASEGEFVWVDGTACNCNIKSQGNWADNQPDDWNREEDCIALSGDGKWHDRPCRNGLKWICEKQTDICST